MVEAVDAADLEIAYVSAPPLTLPPQVRELREVFNAYLEQIGAMEGCLLPPTPTDPLPLHPLALPPI